MRTLLALAAFALSLAGHQSRAQGFVNTLGGPLADDAVGVALAPGGFRVAVRSFEAGGHRAKLLGVSPSGSQPAWTALPGLSGAVFAQAMAEAADGGAFIAGSRIPPGASHHDGFVARLAPGGAVQWSSSPALLGDQQFLAVHPLPDGGCVAAGLRVEDQGHDAWVMRFTPAGAVEWSVAIADFSDVEAHGIAVQGDHLILTGRQLNFGGTTDAWIARLNLEGDVAWTSSWGGVRNEIGRAVLPLGPGAFVLAGSTNSDVPLDVTENRRKDHLYLVAFDLNGDSLWTRAIGDTLFDRRAFGMAAAPNGDLIVVGERSATINSSDAFACRISPAGAVVWQRSWDTGKEERLLAVRALADGFVACGWSFGEASRQALLIRRNANGD